MTIDWEAVARALYREYAGFAGDGDGDVTPLEWFIHRHGTMAPVASPAPSPSQTGARCHFCLGSGLAQNVAPAQTWVADFVDGVPVEQHYPRPLSREPIPPQLIADLQARVVGRMLGAAPAVCLDVGRAYLASEPAAYREPTTISDTGTGQAVTVEHPQPRVAFTVPSVASPKEERPAGGLYDPCWHCHWFRGAASRECDIRLVRVGPGERCSDVRPITLRRAAPETGKGEGR